MEDNFVPLFAFASNLEFFGVFPECKSFVQNNIRLGEIVELPEGRGFAVVLGVGLLEFATNLSVLLSRFSAEGPFTHVVLAGICGAYPDRGLEIGSVVRVDSEIVGDLGVVLKAMARLRLGTKFAQPLRTVLLPKHPRTFTNLRRYGAFLPGFRI